MSLLSQWTKAETDASKFSSNLQFIKLLAAMVVVVRHGTILLGDENPLPGIRLDSVGIWVFFVVSGYLIPGAWQRAPGVSQYVFARLRRLTPALVVVVVLSAFVLGPLVSTLAFAEYFNHEYTWRYLLNVVYNPQFALPGVFEANPYPYAVNGSLWSLPPQLLCYLLVPVLFLVRRKPERIAFWGALFILCETIVLSGQGKDVVFWGTQANATAEVAAFFIAGVLIKELGLRRSTRIALVVLALGSTLIVLVPGVRPLALVLMVSYAVVSFSMASWPGLRQFNRLPDLSYGVFLVGFPVQQYLVWAHPHLTGWVSLLLTVLLSLLGAILLERFVERPSGRLGMSWTHPSIRQAPSRRTGPAPTR